MRDKTFIILAVIFITGLWAFADYADSNLAPSPCSIDLGKYFEHEPQNENQQSIKVYVRTLDNTARSRSPSFGWKRCRNYWQAIRWRYYYDEE